ncbi:MAG: HPr family phosphocarrier protein [Clostridia bacterium]
MKSISISLNMAESVKKFVQIVAKYDYDMDLRSGRYVVDAKSILGIFSLNLNTPVVLEVYSDKCDDLLNELTCFVPKL